LTSDSFARAGAQRRFGPSGPLIDTGGVRRTSPRIVTSPRAVALVRVPSCRGARAARPTPRIRSIGLVSRSTTAPASSSAAGGSGAGRQRAATAAGAPARN
jgi:hypothetical protein